MPVYILRSTSQAQLLRTAVMNRRLTAARRAAQVAEVEAKRWEDPGHGEIYRWLSQADPAKVKRITKSEGNTRITATALVEMPEDEARRMAAEIPSAELIRDRPLNLIQPNRGAAETKAALSAPDLWHLEAIGLNAARAKGFTGTGQGVRIGVLDTGIDPNHPEIAGKIAEAYTFDVPEWRVNPLFPSYDTDGHGTHVAGLIAGSTVGVAPGVMLVNGIMIPGGHGNLSDFILALEWSVASLDVPVQIINMSAGIPGYLPEMAEAVAGVMSVGVLPVMAIGNEGRNRTRSPGNYNEVVSVGASDKRNRVASFSGGGTLVVDHQQYTVPDLVAPGKEVYSCLMTGGYEAWNGTSMATPIVSGIAALILEKYPEIEVTDLIDALLDSCVNLGLPVERQGMGLVQVKSAL